MGLPARLEADALATHDESGDVHYDLFRQARQFTEDVTYYFDKALGHEALAAFILGYVQPEEIPDARVLYIEHSHVVALSTKPILERHGGTGTHVTGVEEEQE